MSVTIVWSLIAVPESKQTMISAQYYAALEKSRYNFAQKEKAWELWKKHPDWFMYFTRACDIEKRFEYICSWLGEEYSDYLSLFLSPGFDRIFLDNFKFDGPGQYQDDFYFAEVVVSHGNTPADILFQSLGPELATRIPGFFGNIYLTSEQVPAVLTDYENILSAVDLDKSVDVGARWAEAPCNMPRDNITMVRQIIYALPKALVIAKEKQCGLLCLTAVAG
jgi:hypothetical protein